MTPDENFQRDDAALAQNAQAKGCAGRIRNLKRDSSTARPDLPAAGRPGCRRGTKASGRSAQNDGWRNVSDDFACEGFGRESGRRGIVDAPGESVYSRTVPVKKIQVGQVWKKDDSGDTFLITKVYNEALATFAVLRKTGSEDEPPIRIKVSKSGASASLPGFSYTQESDEF